MAQVVIVATHRLVRHALMSLITGEAGLPVVGLAGTGMAGLGLVQALQPNLAVVGPHLPDMAVPAFIRALRAVAPSTAVQALGHSVDAAEVVATLTAGADAYLPLWAPAADLVQSLRALQAGGAWIHPQAAQALLTWLRGQGSPQDPHDAPGFQEGWPHLTARERAILSLLAAGCSTAAMARRLGLTEHGVRKHLASIYRKLGVRNRTQAATAALHLAGEG